MKDREGEVFAPLWVGSLFTFSPHHLDSPFNVLGFFFFSSITLGYHVCHSAGVAGMRFFLAAFLIPPCLVVSPCHHYLQAFSRPLCVPVCPSTHPVKLFHFLIASCYPHYTCNTIYVQTCGLEYGQKMDRRCHFITCPQTKQQTLDWSDHSSCSMLFFWFTIFSAFFFFLLSFFLKYNTVTVYPIYFALPVTIPKLQALAPYFTDRVINVNENKQAIWQLFTHNLYGSVATNSNQFFWLMQAAWAGQSNFVWTKRPEWVIVQMWIRLWFVYVVKSNKLTAVFMTSNVLI